MKSTSKFKFSKITKKLTPWAGVAGVFSLGFLPCPGCGAPMLWHLWPVAGVLALHTLHVERKKKQGLTETENELVNENEATRDNA